MKNVNKMTLDQIKAVALPILKQADIKKAALFGSYVRGDNYDNSDIDILVAFPEDATLLDVVRLQRNLEGQLQKKVDVVSYNGISPLLRDSILANQYPIL